MITIVDYGMGNLGSIFNMFKRIGVEATISGIPEEISKAKKILLPGVGSFDSAMKNILQTGIKEVLDHKALKEKIPILGICLGMQLLTQGSEEGQLPGLGWLPAKTIAFSFPQNMNLKVPHMGWNTVRRNENSSLTDGFDEEFKFYFVHSFYVKVNSEKYSLLKTNYGIEFDSAIGHDNIFGTQFHPEKSHRYGMHLLSNFAKI